MDVGAHSRRLRWEQQGLEVFVLGDHLVLQARIVDRTIEYHHEKLPLDRFLRGASFTTGRVPKDFLDQCRDDLRVRLGMDPLVAPTPPAPKDPPSKPPQPPPEEVEKPKRAGLWTRLWSAVGHRRRVPAGQAWLTGSSRDDTVVWFETMPWIPLAPEPEAVDLRAKSVRVELTAASAPRTADDLFVDMTVVFQVSIAPLPGAVECAARVLGAAGTFDEEAVVDLLTPSLTRTVLESVRSYDAAEILERPEELESTLSHSADEGLGYGYRFEEVIVERCEPRRYA